MSVTQTPACQPRAERHCKQGREIVSVASLGPRAVAGAPPQSPSPHTRGLFTLWQTADGGGPIRIPRNRVRRRGSAPPDPPQSLGNPQPQRRQQRLAERDPRPGTGGCGAQAAVPPWRPPTRGQAPWGRRAPWRGWPAQRSRTVFGTPDLTSGPRSAHFWRHSEARDRKSRP